MITLNKQMIENRLHYFVEETKDEYSVLVETFVDEGMATSFVNLYKKAVEKKGVIAPCRNKRWNECISTYHEDYMLWYDDINGSTGIVR